MIKTILALGRCVAGIFLIVSGFGLFAGSFALWPKLIGTASASAAGGLVFVGLGATLLHGMLGKVSNPEKKNDVKDELERKQNEAAAELNLKMVEPVAELRRKNIEAEAEFEKKKQEAFSEYRRKMAEAKVAHQKTSVQEKPQVYC
jgi:hypothetical protein